MVGIIHYKMGNITSVKNALSFLNIPSVIVRSGKDLDSVSHVILPGVGAFPEGMKNLKELGFVDAIKKNVVGNNKPFLGICLGMQLLATVGYECKESTGLNLIPGEVKRLPELDIRIPHTGWNNISVVKENSLLKENADFYFVHSFYFKLDKMEDEIATVDYGKIITAGIRKGNIFGVQFHPEKSQQSGLDVLSNFYKIKS